MNQNGVAVSNQAHRKGIIMPIGENIVCGMCPMLKGIGKKLECNNTGWEIEDKHQNACKIFCMHHNFIKTIEYCIATLKTTEKSK